MIENNKYFDVLIKDDNSYRIVESSSKPQEHNCALATLKKIELIVKNKFNYSQDSKDKYSTLPKEKLWGILDKKSLQIRNAFIEKQTAVNQSELGLLQQPTFDPTSTFGVLAATFEVLALACDRIALILSCIVRKVFDQAQQIDATYQRIENYISPPSALSTNCVVKKVSNQDQRIDATYQKTEDYTSASCVILPGDVITVITQHLNRSELAVFAQVNRQASMHAMSAMKRKAQELGYEGHDPIEAMKYQNELIQEMERMESVLPSEYKGWLVRSTKTGRVDLDKTLDEIKSANWTFFLRVFDRIRSYESDLIVPPYNDGYKDNLKFIKLLVLQCRNSKSMNPAPKLDQKFFGALCNAARYGAEEIVELLLLQMNKSIPFNSKESSALLYDLIRGLSYCHKNEAKAIKILKLLIEHGVNINTKIKDGYSGCSVLHQIAHTSFFALALMLLEAGADTTITDWKRQRPLDYAWASHCEGMFYLLGYETDMRNALLWAAGAGEAGVVKFLIKKEVSVNGVDSKGYTPLAYAAEKGWIEIVQLLIKAGAHTNFVDNNGRTPLALAMLAGKKDVVQLLTHYDTSSKTRSPRLPRIT